MQFTGPNLAHVYPLWFEKGACSSESILLGFRTIVCLLFFMLASAAAAQEALYPPSMRLATRQFHSPESGPFLEVQAEFLASNVSWVGVTDSTFVAAVRWTVVAYDSAGVVAGFAKSTARTGELPLPGDFVDVARISLNAGPHVVEFEVEDIGNPDRPVLKHDVVVEVEEYRKLDISDLFVVQGVKPASVPSTPFTRSGKDILPLVDSRISADAPRVAFYGELYGTHESFGDGGDFLVVAGFRMPGQADGWLTETKRYFRMKAAPVVPVLEALPTPPPGLHELVVEVMTPDQELLVAGALSLESVSSDVQDAAEASGNLSPFVLEINDRDSLLATIETLIPIADAGERRSIEFVLQGANLIQLQSFFENFWMSRDPDHPERAWKAYRTEVAVADAEYGSCPHREGHETDMGWILLRYGRPNTIVQRHHGTQYYPYEIWHYHKAGQFNNRRFLFYTPQVVGECFELLHSDHPQELRNADWLDILKTRELGHSVVQTGLNQLGRRDTYSREEPEDLFFNPR